MQTASDKIARDLFSLYHEDVVTAAKRIFNTYGGKGMTLTDRVVAVIEYARADSKLSGEQMADVLHLLDEVADNGAIADFSEAETD
jgi:hypothetical protein